MMKKKKINYKKSCEALAQSIGGLNYVKEEVNNYGSKVQMIEDKIKRLQTNKNADAETRKKDAYVLLVEKQQLQQNIDNLQKTIEVSERNISVANERIRDLEADLTESELKIKSLELKKQINDSNNLLVTTSFNNKIDNNYKDAEEEINKATFVIEAKSSVVKQITCRDSISDAKTKAEEELNSLNFES